MTGKISGVILAGGAACRFDGRMKSKIIIEGEPIISRIISVIRDIFDEIIIVTNIPEEFADFNFCKIVQDEIPGAGPLAGIHAAMKISSNDSIFVFAGDMPFLDKEIIKKMIKAYKKSEYNALIPEIEENIEPLHSLYSTSMTENLKTYLNTSQNNAVRDYVKSINAGYFKLERSEKNKIAFTNINSASDLT